ncbi:hypothetical protein [Streptomyces sp. NPDC001260]|uniref:hypothetical protein n=1 Tax=Streptomyces sp. NPDC001260 TaxID=3364551 RepID=UPI00367AE336
MPKAHVFRRYGGPRAEALAEAAGRGRGSGRRPAGAGVVDVRGETVMGAAG